MLAPLLALSSTAAPEPARFRGRSVPLSVALCFSRGHFNLAWLSSGLLFPIGPDGSLIPRFLLCNSDLKNIFREFS